MDIQAALDTAGDQPETLPGGVTPAALTIRERAMLASPTTEDLPFDAVVMTRSLNDALFAASITARRLIDRITAASRAQTAYTLAWSRVEALAQRFGGGRTEPQIGDLRAAFEAAPLETYSSMTLYDRVRAALMPAALAELAAAKHDLNLVHGQEQRARSLAETTSTLAVSAARSLDSALRLSSPRRRILPF